MSVAVDAVWEAVNGVFAGQLLSTADEVAKLQEELELMKPMLAEAVQESVATMQLISEDTVRTMHRRTIIHALWALKCILNV